MDDYIPPKTDLMVANHIGHVVEEFLMGGIDGIAFAAIRSNGKPCRLYLNKVTNSGLQRVLQNLVVDIDENYRFNAKSTAPQYNRSSRIH